ncbi:MFS transporter [Micromonospora fiedleri]|uniref:MFS transporter n=1 Tax=Micromonospora fiedleri TaxID=1157498 RepID=A0ABS1ULZ6_9ACTN|nr:MFS transporter [Micromonospora fiedleri]MBL6277362.1 MFS transporter [Micromonospora fiedleri]
MANPLTSAAPAHAEQPDTRRWLALILLCTANFMVILDSQIVIMALPPISEALHLTPEAAQWVINANLLTFGGLLLLGGRLADLLGRRRIFILGTVLFLLVSVASGLAPNAEVLIAARALHGVSAALMAPTALSILSTTFAEGAPRNKALSLWAGIAGIGAVTALLIGGALASIGWQWIFFVNVPVALVMLVISPLLLRESRDAGIPRTYDVAGALTSTTGLVLLVYAVVVAPVQGWLSPVTLGLIVASGVLFALFVVIERRSSAPLVPLSIFRKPNLTGGNLAMVTMGMLAFGFSVTISQYSQIVLGLSPLEFGLRQAIMPAMAFIGAYVGQRFVTRLGFRPVAAVCLVLLGAGSLIMALTATGSMSYGATFLALVPFGVGLGLGTTAASAAALSGVAYSESGLASGFNTAAQQVGGGLGVAVVLTVIASYAPAVASPTAGFQAAFAACVVFAVVGLVITLTMMRSKRATDAALAAPTPALNHL